MYWVMYVCWTQYCYVLSYVCMLVENVIDLVTVMISVQLECCISSLQVFWIFSCTCTICNHYALFSCSCSWLLFYIVVCTVGIAVYKAWLCMTVTMVLAVKMAQYAAWNQLFCMANLSFVPRTFHCPVFDCLQTSTKNHACFLLQTAISPIKDIRGSDHEYPEVRKYRHSEKDWKHGLVPGPALWYLGMRLWRGVLPK